MSDSDGDDAMAYFLPNGIADDSPPKRSSLMSSFGSIGATRFGGIYGSSAQPAPLDLSAPLYGGLGGGEPLASATPGGSMASTASAGTSLAPSSSFLLSDLGGEILQPRGHDSTGHAIGGARNPFAFSGAFASLSAAESDSRSRLAGGNSGGGLYEPSRNDVVGTPKGNSSSSSGFRSDAEIFAPSSSSATGSSGVYGRPTLNANAPAFMASSAQDPAPFGSSSPSAWPTMNVKPRRAPPGLSKPTEGPISSSVGGRSGASDGASLSLPPGLPHPAHSTAFGGYSSSSSSSLFSGEGVRQFASKLQPNFPSLSDTFHSDRPQTDQDFKSALSELNAKSMSVEEIQSNLKATALAAAHDVVSDAPVDQKAPRLTTPRKATRSPRRGVEFKSPSTGDEKREQSTRAPVDPRSRTPTRRHEATAASSAAHGAASPVTSSRASGDRRSRSSRDPTSSESAGRNSRAAISEPSSRSGRRSRGGGQGASSESRAGSRNTQGEGASVPLPIPTTNRKKPPSSVSSVGSDDQLLAVSTVAGAVEDHVKAKESARETKPTGRASSTKKTTTPTPSQDKRGGAKRQVYREKPALPEALKTEVVGTLKTDVTVQGGSDADASGADSQADENVEDDVNATPPKTNLDKTAARKMSAVVKAPTSPSTTLSAPKAPLPEVQIEPATCDGTQQKLEDSSESIVEEQTTTPVAIDDESASVPESPRAASSDVIPSTPNRPESDSGSEIPELSSRTVRASDRKTSAKEHKKDKHKKEKSDKKKAIAPAKSNKKEKRDSSSSGKGDLADDEPFSSTPIKKPSVAPTVKIAALLRDGRVLAKRSIVAIWSACWFLCTEFADRINLKGFLGWSFSYLESFLAVVFSVILLLSLHGASFFIRLHRVAFRAVLTHRHVGFCFAFLYAFPFLVQYVFPWAPPWAPVCLWYAFLVQLFCTSGPAAMVATFRIVLPLMFLVEGISHHSFLLDLNGAELLLASFILSAMKTSNLCSPIFLMSLAVQCLSAVFLGSELVVQWFQMTLALYSLHAMAATDEDWAGLGDDEEDLSCRPLSMHHSIADYNYHPAPSAPSIQKTKRLDRRALAYVRGRKLR